MAKNTGSGTKPHLAQNPTWIFLSVQSHVAPVKSSKTAEKPEHFLCRIIPWTVSVSPQTKDTECTNERGKLEGKRQSGGCLVPAVSQGSGSCSLREGRQCSICQKTGSHSGLLLLPVCPKQVCACHYRTHMMWWGVWVPLDSENRSIPSLWVISPASATVVTPPWPELQWQFLLRGERSKEPLHSALHLLMGSEGQQPNLSCLEGNTSRSLRHFRVISLLCNPEPVQVSQQTGRPFQSYRFKSCLAQMSSLFSVTFWECPRRGWGTSVGGVHGLWETSPTAQGCSAISSVKTLLHVLPSWIHTASFLWRALKGWPGAHKAQDVQMNLSPSASDWGKCCKS